MIERQFMEAALQQARAADAAGEVPVGAVLVKDGRILSVGRNRREETKSALAHAEIEAIHAACQAVGDWRLTGCTLYVTLEPCRMCFGAICSARIDRVVFGAYDPAAGCVSTGDAVPQDLQFIGGYMETECRELLQTTFQTLRNK